MKKRLKKKIQKAKEQALKTTRKTSAAESKRIVADTVKKVKAPKIARKPKRKRTLYKVRKNKVQQIQAQPVGIKPIKKDFHVSGAYDNFSFGDKAITNRGISGALNRLVMKHPELTSKINEFLEVVGERDGIQELQEMFAESYFDNRETSLSYNEDLYAVYEDGYAEFVSMLDRRIAVLQQRRAMQGQFTWGK